MEPPARLKIPLTTQNHDQTLPTKTAILPVAKASFMWLYVTRRKGTNSSLKVWPSDTNSKMYSFSSKSLGFLTFKASVTQSFEEPSRGGTQGYTVRGVYRSDDVVNSTPRCAPRRPRTGFPRRPRGPGRLLRGGRGPPRP